MSASAVDRWQPHEDQVLREQYRQRTDAELAALLPGRTAMAVHQRLRVLRLYRVKWLPEHDERLRAAYGRVRTRELAAELGRPVGAIKQRAAKLGLSAGRCYTPEQIALVRELYLTLPAAEIAGRVFGNRRSAKAVYQLAFRLGLAKHPHWPPEFLERIRVLLTSEDLTDAEASRRLGLTREQVTHARKRLGLPANQVAILASRRRGVRTQYERLGIRTAGELRSRSYREFARRRGWPAGLRLRAVQILEVLAVAGGPLGRHEIAERIGWNMEIGRRNQRTILRSNDPEGSYLANLVARGLVIILPRAQQITGQGKGRSRHLYTLSPAALDVIIRRASSPPEGELREALGCEAVGR